MSINQNMILIFAIAVLLLFLLFNRCTLKCGCDSSDDDEKAMKLIDELQVLKDKDEIEDIDMDTLMKLKNEGKLGMIEINKDNKDNKKEYYYPYGLYSGYNYWRPYGYHHYYYPYRRYLRPYNYSYYPGRWMRHYGNYYYTTW